MQTFIMSLLTLFLIMHSMAVATDLVPSSSPPSTLSSSSSSSPTTSSPPPPPPTTTQQPPVSPPSTTPLPPGFGEPPPGGGLGVSSSSNRMSSTSISIIAILSALLFILLLVGVVLAVFIVQYKLNNGAELGEGDEEGAAGAAENGGNAAYATTRKKKKDKKGKKKKKGSEQSRSSSTTEGEELADEAFERARGGSRGGGGSGEGRSPPPVKTHTSSSISELVILQDDSNQHHHHPQPSEAAVFANYHQPQPHLLSGTGGKGGDSPLARSHNNKNANAPTATITAGSDLQRSIRAIQTMNRHQHSMLERHTAAVEAQFRKQDEEEHRKRVEAVRKGEYRKGRLLGRGTTASVYTAVLDDGSTIAAKAILITGKVDEETGEDTVTSAVRKIELDLRKFVELPRFPFVVSHYGFRLIRRTSVPATTNSPGPEDPNAFDPNRAPAHTGYEVAEVDILMEYVGGGSLSALQRCSIEPMPLPALKRYAEQILVGLAFLHRHGIAHRDLKGDNILLDERNGCAKICDFGTAKVAVRAAAGPLRRQSEQSSASSAYSHRSSRSTNPPVELEFKSTETATTNTAVGAATAVTPRSLITEDGFLSKSLVGTPYFMAPEVVHHVLHENNQQSASYAPPPPPSPYTALYEQHREDGYNALKADIWSYGITVLEIMNGGVPPWPQFQTGAQAVYHIADANSVPYVPAAMASDDLFKDFVFQALDRAPYRRPSAEALLQHPWLRS